MSYLPNNWNAIRRFYAQHDAEIKSTPSNQWALDPYEWSDHHMINFTPIENWLWADIRQCGAVLYPQYPIFNFFVDFANPVAKVAIECDGAAFHKDKAKDAARDLRLRSDGWLVYRITGRHCKLECDDETGAPSLPLLFISAICNQNNISMFDTPHSGIPVNGLTDMSGDVDEWWESELARRAEALARKWGEL